MKKLLYVFVLASLAFAIYNILVYSIPKISLEELGKYIGKEVQIRGKVIPESLKIYENNNTMIFDITDGKNIVRVIYKMEKLYIPSGSQEIIAIVRGKVLDEKTIVAKQVLISCPSKYEVKVY